MASTAAPPQAVQAELAALERELLSTVSGAPAPPPPEDDPGTGASSSATTTPNTTLEADLMSSLVSGNPPPSVPSSSPPLAAGESAPHTEEGKRFFNSRGLPARQVALRRVRGQDLLSVERADDLKGVKLEAPKQDGLFGEISRLFSGTDWHAAFGIERSQSLLESYVCSLSEGPLLLPGKLFVFRETIAFRMDVTTGADRVIALEDVTEITKRDDFIPINGLEVQTVHGESLYFSSFLAREGAYGTMTTAWRAVRQESAGDREAARMTRQGLYPAVRVGFELEQFLYVKIGGGTNLVPADLNGMSDPFVKLRVGRLQARTRTVYSTLDPDFDEVFAFPLSRIDSRKDRLQVKVFDEDLVKEDFLGEFVLSVTDVQSGSEPLRGGGGAGGNNNRGRQRWVEPELLPYTLLGRSADEAVSGELTVSTWVASSEHPAYRVATIARIGKGTVFQSASAATRSVLSYEVPQLGMVHVRVCKGRGLRSMDAGGTSDPYVKLSLGDQRSTTRVARGTLDPVWMERFSFVGRRPYSKKLTLEIYDRDPLVDQYMGVCELDLTRLPVRAAGATDVPAGSQQWWRVKPKKQGRGNVAAAGGEGGDVGESLEEEATEQEAKDPSKVRDVSAYFDFSALFAAVDEATLRNTSDDAMPDLGELQVEAFIDEEYFMHSQSSIVQNKAPLGELHLDVIQATLTNGWEKKLEPYVLVGYGDHFARLPVRRTGTNNVVEWRQPLVFPIWDSAHVATVGLFDSRFEASKIIGASGERMIGRFTVQPSTLISGKEHTFSVNLTTITGGKTWVDAGTLDVRVRVVRQQSFSGMLAHYSSPVVPPKWFLDPPAESTANMLEDWQHTVQSMALITGDPPIPKETVKAMRMRTEDKFSPRRTKAQISRIIVALAPFAPVLTAFEKLRNWDSPFVTALLHLYVIFLLKYPHLVLPSILLGLVGVQTARFVQKATPAIGIDQALSMGNPLREAQDARASMKEGEEPTAGDQKGLFDSNVIKDRYDVLTGYALSAQKLVFSVANFIDKLTGLLSWDDAILSPCFYAACMLGALLTPWLPYRLLACAAFFHTFRHPSLRTPVPNAVVQIFQRLPDSRHRVA